MRIDRNKFEWAVFLYNNTEIDECYNKAKSKGDNEKNKEYFCTVVKFLNKWKTRVPKKFYKKMTTWYVETGKSLLEALKGKTIYDIGFEDESTIKNLYKSLCDLTVDIKNENTGKTIERGFGPIATGKTLHLLNPELFVAWDTNILKSYGLSLEMKGEKGAEEYMKFLKIMERLALKIRSSKNDEEEFLSNCISLNEENSQSDNGGNGNRKTMAKFLDEYNWIVYTKNAKLPPKWYPGKPS